MLDWQGSPADTTAIRCHEHAARLLRNGENMRSSSTQSGETRKAHPTNQSSHSGPKDKFTPELRILVASLLSMVVIIGYMKFSGPRPPEHPQQQNQPMQTGPATAGTPASNAPAATSTPAIAPTGTAATPTSPPVGDSQERSIVVENALYRVEFSNRGAVVKSWQLKNYKDDSKPQKTLDLVHANASEQIEGWPLSLVIDDPQQEKAANTGLYKVSNDSSSLEAPADLTFTWSDGHLQVMKTFHFDQSYTVSVETTTVNNGARVHAGLAWLGGFGDPKATNPAPLTAVNTFYGENGKLTTSAIKKLDGREKWSGIWISGKQFSGIEDRCFTAAFLPPLDAHSTPLETRYWKDFHIIQVDGKEQADPIAEVATASGAQPMAMRVYVGPKDYDDLKAMRPPLNSLVQFGWLEFIADPMFHGMKWLHEYIPNWGWTIVALTLVINTVLFPLRISSYKSTLKMQRVAPEIKQIQEKYKKYKVNDPRRPEMKKEVMAVYSREGINPVGGCVPMLLQMPVWIGLNTALRGTIELRHASWMWINDLASKDPYYILPVTMGLSMYLVSKMTPVTTADAQQAQMAKIMPLMMAGMFVVFPFSSGLALYILTSNMMGIAQQWYLNRTHPLPAPVKPAQAKK
jgi:YidC/Oxa1 family membrane protein insertase